MRKTAWLVVLALLALLYTASSIPGLRVLPVLRHLYSLSAGFDGIFSWVARWIARRIPLNFDELAYMDLVMQDFLMYVRDNPVIIEFFLRKLAHIFVFFVITLALFFLLSQYLYNTSLAVLFSFIGGFLLALLDEFRQSFVPDRVASAVDVFVDMIGVMLAILLILFSLLITNGDRQRNFHKQL